MLKPADFQYLADCPNLTHLKIDTQHALPETYTMLATVKPLRQLTIETNQSVGKTSDLQQISQLSQIASLRIGHLDRDLTDEEVVELTKMQWLDQLVFQWLPMPDVVAQNLARELPDCQLSYNGQPIDSPRPIDSAD